MLPTARPSFSQRHPFIFGFLLILAAVALFMGASAALRHLTGGTGPFAGPRVGVVRVEGMIADISKTTAWMDTLRDEPSVRGVLLRVDSPGGGVAASQELLDAVRRMARVKPVVVSMGTVAASGGYYISLGATRVIANPATLTGSIGVKMELPNVQGLMDKLGLARQTLVSGDMKDAGSPFREMTPQEREYLQSIVMDMYDQFVTEVANSRNLPVEKVRAVADGRALTGRQAHELGLVDALGGMDVAQTDLQQLCGIVERPVLVEQPKPSSWLRDALETVLELEPASRVVTPGFLYVY